jgi:DNA polymerase-3 subunit delta'
LLKVLEEPPSGTFFLLNSARPDEIPETIRSRCQDISFPPLSEEFVVDALVREGIERAHALLVCRLSGGNVGRARRMALSEDGLGFRSVALDAMASASAGPAGALAAAENLTAAAKDFRGVLAIELAKELEPFLDARGRPEDAFRGVVRRLEEQHERRLRRAEREFLDSSLLALAAYCRDLAVLASGGGRELLINLDRPGDLEDGAEWSAAAAAIALGAIEQARADLADETNLNPRLTLERLFLRLSWLRREPAASLQ